MRTRGGGGRGRGGLVEGCSTPWEGLVPACGGRGARMCGGVRVSGFWQVKGARVSGGLG